MFGITKSPIDFGGGSAPAWSPLDLDNLRQYVGGSYYSSPVDGKQVVESIEPHGDVRAPEPGACWNFDGANDYGSRAAILTGDVAYTLCCWIIYQPNAAWQILMGCDDDAGYHDLGLAVNNSNEVTFRSYEGSYSNVVGPTIPAGKVHLAVTREVGGVSKIYINGVLSATGTTHAVVSTTHFRVGKVVAFYHFLGKLWDARVYSVAKTLAEIEAIRDCDATSIDKTNALAIYPCNERAGTTGYNIVANANHLTLSGPITEATFHTTDASITSNVNNVLGYRLSGGVRIPAINSTTAADGNALTYAGLSPYPATIDTPCITLDGVNDYINLGDVSTSPTTISLVVKLASDNQEIMTLQNSTATAVTVVAGVLTFGGSLTVSAISVDGSVVSAAAAGVLLNDNEWHTLSLTLTAISCSALRIGTDGSGFGAISVCELELTAGGATKTFPFQEGPGTAVDNVKVYWYKTDGTYGAVASALVGVTVASAWGTRCPGYVRDHAFEFGGRLDALGAFCPLVPGTALCADGNAATITAGNITGNPYSRVNFDPFDAAELGALAVPGEFDSLPCVTGNGSNVTVEVGDLIEFNSTSSFTIWGWSKIGSLVNATGMWSKRLSAGDSMGFGIWHDGYYYLDFHKTSASIYGYALNTIFPVNTPFHWCVVYDGTETGNANRLKFYLNGVQQTLIFSGTVPSTGPDLTGATLRLLKYSASTFARAGDWISSVGISTDALDADAVALLLTSIPTGCKYFPLTDGSGADIAMYEDGVATIISNAIQGTLTNVWANKTDGQVDHEFPEAVRAIVPRDQQFNDGESIHFATQDPLTGTDLTDALDFVS